MAGGPSTPELTTAVSRAGGLGFLAGGYLTADKLSAQIHDTRQLTHHPFGVNLFVVAENAVDEGELSRYAPELAVDAEALNTTLGQPGWHDDHLEDKVEAVLKANIEIVSFVFGIPSQSIVARLASAGVTTAITVTRACLPIVLPK